LAEVQQLATRLIHEQDNETTLDLSGQSLHPFRLLRDDVLLTALTLIAPFVTNLQIHDIIASLGTSEILAVLIWVSVAFGNAPRLRKVDLANNALGSTRGLSVLTPLLQNGAIEQWHFCNNGLVEEDAQIMQQLLRGSSNLKSLALGSNEFGEAGAKHIRTLLKTLSALEEFVYDHGTHLETRIICNGLAALPHPERLTKLDLHDCQVGAGIGHDAGTMTALCKCLEKAKNLQHLNLRNCNLGTDELKLVLAALKTSQAALQSLELGGNRVFAVEGAATVLREFLVGGDFPTADTVTLLDLSDNELGDDGLALLSDGLAACPKLQILKLDNNEIEDAGAEALTHHRIDSLKTLSLTGNQNIPAGVARRLDELYDTVTVDEDLNEDEDAVDKLGAALTAVVFSAAQQF